MANDPRSVFGRHAAKQTTISNANKELSPAQRMTAARTTGEPDVLEGNVFDRAAARNPKPVVVEKQSAPRTRAGVVETPELTAAREAEEARRVRKAAAAAKPVYELPKEEDLIWIVEAFMVRHQQDFYPSAFNSNNLIRLVKIWATEGRIGWTPTGFELAHAFLAKGGYYEPAPEHARRGQAAPKEIPEDGATPTQPEPINQVVKQRTVISVEEARQLRNVNFDDLAAHVRSGYKR